MKRHDGDRALLFENVDRVERARSSATSSPARPTSKPRSAPTDTACEAAMLRALTDPIAPQMVDDAPCQAVRIDRDIDLGSMLPVLRHAPGDVGRFVTAGVVIVRDPDTGVHNASYHRMQLLGGNRTAIKLDYGRHLRAAHERRHRARRRSADRRVHRHRPLAHVRRRLHGLADARGLRRIDGCRRHPGRAAGGDSRPHQRPSRARGMRDRPRGAHFADRDDGRRAVRRVRRLLVGRRGSTRS